VLVSNLLGAAVIAGLLVLIGPALGVADRAAFVEIAHKVLDHGTLVVLGSALLAGWLMGLMSWLVAASRDTVGQIVIVWIIAFVIGLCGLHHAIVGSVEVLAGLLVSPDIGFGDFGRFLVTTAVGNAVGGTVFVALVKYGHAVRGEES
jgi:formate/nitrite transporter FocA (FNT family)